MFGEPSRSHVPNAPTLATLNPVSNASFRPTRFSPISFFGPAVLAIFVDLAVQPPSVERSYRFSSAFRFRYRWLGVCTHTLPSLIQTVHYGPRPYYFPLPSIYLGLIHPRPHILYPHAAGFFSELYSLPNSPINFIFFLGLQRRL